MRFGFLDAAIQTFDSPVRPIALDAYADEKDKDAYNSGLQIIQV
jgi:hypothetical protein